MKKIEGNQANLEENLQYIAIGMKFEKQIKTKQKQKLKRIAGKCMTKRLPIMTPLLLDS